jgi:hypothetical protein
VDVWVWIAIGLGALVLVKSASVPSGVQALAQAIALAEGWGLSNDIGTARNNPGNLTDGTGQIRTFDTVDQGWSALYELLQRITAGSSTYYSPAMTIEQMASVYTSTESSSWAGNVAYGLQQQGYATVTTQTTIGAILRNEL